MDNSSKMTHSGHV